MFFYMPTKVYCEKGCVENHAEELRKLGKKALIMTGRSSSKKNGALDAVIQALEKEGAGYVVFDEVEENPSVETVMKARKTGLEAGADFVVGIGGGSPMDAAKAAALMMKHPNEGEEFLYTKGSDAALPVAAVPTTCGTGSEATPWSILTRHELKIKGSIPHKIFPSLALADPGYLEKAPMSVIVSTAVDAMGHCIESYINANAAVYTKMLCEKSLQLFCREKEMLLGERAAVYEDWENLMNASTLAGMSISHTSTSLPHGLSYYLTCEDDMPHGKAVGVFEAAYVEAAPEVLKEQMLRLLEFKDIAEMRQFMGRLLGSIEIESRVEDRAIEGMLQNRAKLVNCPYEVDESVLRKFFDGIRKPQ